MTSLEVLKKFSRVTGITDPKVEQIVRHQESWVYKNFDKNVTTTMGVDEGNGKSYSVFDEHVEGTWPSWKEDVKKRIEQSAKDYNQFICGDWKPHKKQEEFHKSKKQYRTYVSDKGYWSRFDKMINDMKKDLNEKLFSDDEEYYDADWREAEKPLALPPHEENKEND